MSRVGERSRHEQPHRRRQNRSGTAKGCMALAPNLGERPGWGISTLPTLQTRSDDRLPLKKYIVVFLVFKRLLLIN